MNSPNETLPRTYESEIVPLRERIDAIDISILNSLKNLLDIFEGHSLSRGMADSFLLEIQEKYHPIFRAIFLVIEQKCNIEGIHNPIDITDETRIVAMMKRAMNLAHMHSETIHALDENRVMELLNHISGYLDERFEVVREVGELKWEFHKSPRDDKRWNDLLIDRMSRWTQSGGEDAEIIIPAIWNPIHKIALEIEQEELKKAQLQHWMDENGLLSDPYYETGILEIRGNPKLAGYEVVDTMQRTLEGYRETFQPAIQSRIPIVDNNIPREFFH